MKYSTFFSCFSSIRSLHLGGLPWNSYHLSFFFYPLTHSFPFHSIFRFQLVFHSCPVAPLLPCPIAQGCLHISQYEILVLFEPFQPFKRCKRLMESVTDSYLSNSTCNPNISCPSWSNCALKLWHCMYFFLNTLKIPTL